MGMRKKILIDLDVVTIAKWNSNKNAINFIRRVKAGEFTVYTPYNLLELLGKWKYKRLRDEIKEFYELHSSEIVSSEKLTEKLDELNISETDIVKDLKREGVKEEDILLAIVTSIFELDYLVTLNRKHLRNKKEVINNVLHNYGLEPIGIVLPDEI